MSTSCSTFSEQILAEQHNMKLLILISLIALGNAAKLDRTYLPPTSASSAGGSPGSLLAPGSGSFGRVPLGSSSGIGGQSAGQSEIQAPSVASELTKPSSDQLSQSGYQSGSLPVPGFRQPSGSSGYGQPSKTAGYGSGFDNQLSNSGPEIGASTGPGFDSAGQPNFLGSSRSSIKQSSTLKVEQGSDNIQAYNQPLGAQVIAEEGAQILKYDSENDGETFSYSFETSNGIRAEESGVATNGVRAKGAFGYTGEDGQVYSITYTADENGYLPQGEHLPTPFPIPEEILKSIEKNAKAAAAGTQEGAYRPEDYKNEGSSEAYNTESSFNEQVKGSSQLYEAPQYGLGSDQGVQVSNQNSQVNKAIDQNQNQGIREGQSISAASDNREPQSQSSFGEDTSVNQGYGQPTIGQNIESNQGTSQFTSGQGGAKKDYNRQNSQGQSSIKQSDSDQGQSFSVKASEGQSGYEYNRPQGYGQLEAPSSDKSSTQGSSTSFSRPGTGSIEGFFSPNAQGPKNTYITPTKPGQGSEYQPGQSTFGSGPSGSSSIGRTPTGSQNESFKPTIQGPKNTYITPNQPAQDSEYRPGQTTFGSGTSGSSFIGRAPTTDSQNESFKPSIQGPKNTYLTPSQPGQDSKYRPSQSTFGSRPSGSSFTEQALNGPQDGSSGPTFQGPKNTYITPNQPGPGSEFQAGQSSFGSRLGSSAIGEAPISPEDGSFGSTIQGPKNTYISPNQPRQDCEHRPGQSSFGTGPSGSSSIGQVPTGPQNQYIPPSGQSDYVVNQATPIFGGPRQPPSFDAQEGYKY